VNRNVEDEAAAGAAARATCSEATLRGTYLFADHGVDSATGKHFARAGYEYFDGNGNIVERLLSSNFDGMITNRASFRGTYEVNADCTGRSTYARDVECKYDLFIDPDGDWFTWVQIKPRSCEVVSGVERRVTRKRVGE
jgi:hypothetical protein